MRWSCGRYVYSKITFKPLHNHQFGLARLLKLYIVHLRSIDEIYSHPGGSARKWDRLSLVKLLLLEAFSAIWAHIEDRYLILGLHVDFAEENQTAQLTGLLPGDGLRGKMDGRNYCTMLLRRSFRLLSRSLIEASALWRGVTWYG